MARAAEELALPLPGKSSCCVRGKRILFFLNNSRKARKQGSVILAVWSGALHPAQVSRWLFGLRAAGVSQLLGFVGRLELWFTHFQGLPETTQIRTAVKLGYLYIEVREVLV